MAGEDELRMMARGTRRYREGNGNALCAVRGAVLGCLYSVRGPGVLVFPTSL